MKTSLATVCMLLILSLLNALNPPVVSNISAAQRNDGSHILDIFYDLYDADADLITITLEVSDDDGLTWDISCSQVTGAVGTNVSQGVNKHIVWNLGAEHPGISSNFSFRITADDGFVPTVSTPTFSPVAGTYTSAQSVTITCSTSGATIYYTTDGSEPDEASTVYSSPLAISATTTLKAKAFKTDWTDSATQTGTYTINTAPEGFVLVPAGTFTMGDTRGTGYSNELPTHSVTLNSFYMAKYEVTQGEYQAIMGSNSASGSGVGTSYPVYNVNWYSAVKYCNLKSMADGLTPVYTISGSTNPATWGTVPTSNNVTWNAAICNWSANGYRLPTEAEWEYAARGATNTPDYLYSGSNDINAVAWYDGNNSPNGTKPVGTKAPNSLGLYDMSGNLGEWCWDWFSSTYYSSSPASNPTGASSGSSRVRRGGFWGFSAGGCRVASRSSYFPSGSYYSIGFRLCRAGL